ncbi:MAG TPA: hypothetical protein VEX86_24160 [Longimicrobium sp.]|nr:hypothetical protein [Longimicrobium sp.]
MSKKGKGGGKKGGNMGKAAMLLGAAGLLLFIVGAKRRYQMDSFELDPKPPRPRAGDADGERDDAEK